MRRTALVAAAVAVAVLAPAGALADPVLGPWNSPQVIVATTDCDGDGIEETTVAVMVPRAAEGSAAFGRPGIGHLAGTTSKQVPMGIELRIGGVLVDSRFWGHGDFDFACSFSPFPGALVTVYGFTTPRGGG